MNPEYSRRKVSAGMEDSELIRGLWTVEEDTMLIHYIASHGDGHWNMLALSSGLRRNGRSCRMRWVNYLKPDVKRGNLTQQDKSTIFELHSKWGNRWSKIAQHLPKRTDNEIKNYWRTMVQNQARQLKRTELERCLVSKNKDTAIVTSYEKAKNHCSEPPSPPRSSEFLNQGVSSSNPMLLPQLISVSDHPKSPTASDMCNWKCPSDPECYYSLEDLHFTTMSPIGADASGFFPGCLAQWDDDMIDAPWNTDEHWQFV